ncbi:MAG: LptF/LptG family permease [bacterium]
MRIPTLPRYLLKVFLPFFLLSVFVFSAILLMNHFLRLLNVALLNGAPLGWFLKSLACLMPGMLGMALPLSFLLGLLLALGGLSEQGEILALRASGYSFRQILWPMAALAAMLTILLLLLNTWISPSGLLRFKNARWLITGKISKLRMEPRTFLSVGGWKIYSDTVDNESGHLTEVKLFRYLRTDDGEKPILHVNAPEGRFKIAKGKGLELELKNGGFQQTDAKDPRKFVLASFAGYRVFIPFTGPENPNRDPSMQELTSRQLFRMLRDPKLDLQHRREYTVENSLRFALAVTPLVFFWVGCPLGLVLEKKSRVMGLVLSLAVMFTYYGLLVSSITLGRRFGFVSTWIPWMPDLVIAAAGFYFWKRNLSAR